MSKFRPSLALWSILEEHEFRRAQAKGGYRRAHWTMAAGHAKALQWEAAPHCQEAKRRELLGKLKLPGRPCRNQQTILMLLGEH